MKSILIIVLLLTGMRGKAQDPITLIIKEGITKVIVAMDLQMQRLQNETIWLQNAQKTVENELSRLKLAEIGNWVEKQRDLYENYFDELWRVKAALGFYHRVKELTQKQKTLLFEYRQAYDLFRRDPHFTPDEIAQMQRVYSGILNACAVNLDALSLVVNAFTTQMKDAERLERLEAAAILMDQQLNHLRQFTRGNQLIALQRATERGTIIHFKKLYGL
jgi:hypothetical protein